MLSAPIKTFTEKDNIGVEEFQEIKALRNKYKNQKVYQKLQTQIEAEFKGFCQVRGDGNCYYRSVIYRYIEFLICKGVQYLQKFIELIKSNDGYYKLYDFEGEILKDLVPKLEHLHEYYNAYNKKKLALRYFKNMINTDLKFDYLLICLLKRIIANTYIQNKKTQINGLTPAQMAAAYKLNLANYIAQYVLEFGIDAEGSVPVMTALVLRININAFNLDLYDENIVFFIKN